MIEHMKSWMYGSLRWKINFWQEVDVFLEGLEKHWMARKNKIKILCSCSNCKNGIAWNDVTIIRSHLIVRDFVKDYIVWIHYGETPIKIEKWYAGTIAEECDSFIDGLDGEVPPYSHGWDACCRWWDARWWCFATGSVVTMPADICRGGSCAFIATVLPAAP
jgi:hypothetical protein